MVVIGGVKAEDVLTHWLQHIGMTGRVVLEQGLVGALGRRAAGAVDVGKVHCSGTGAGASVAHAASDVASRVDTHRHSCSEGLYSDPSCAAFDQI